MAPWLGSARAGFTALALVLASLTTVVSPAHAAIVVSGCNAFPSATPLGAAYHDGDVSVAACGPRPAYGGTRTSVF